METKIRFIFDGRKLRIRNIKVCDSFLSKGIGLMFKKNPENMLFIFSKPGKYAIHSCFVRKNFLAIWLLKNRVIDAKIVRPWRLNVYPKEEFDTLLELPFNDNREISRFSSMLERFK